MERKSKLPPGFSEDDFQSLERFDANIDNRLLCEKLKHKSQVKVDMKYSCLFKDGLYHIQIGTNQVTTPSGLPVTTRFEALAKKTIEHMEIYGEKYDVSYSIVNFLYSNIEFFDNSSRDDLLNAVIKDLNTDWTLDCPYLIDARRNVWVETFGLNHERKEEITLWLSGLNKTQIGGVVILGAALGSINISYILINRLNEKVEKEFLNYFFHDCYLEFNRDICFYTKVQIQEIFSNFIFWYRLNKNA